MNKLVTITVLLFLSYSVYGQDSTWCYKLDFQRKRMIMKTSRDFCKDTLGLNSLQFSIKKPEGYSIWESELDIFKYNTENCDSLKNIGFFSVDIYVRKVKNYHWVLKYDVFGTLVDILQYSKGNWNFYWTKWCGKCMYQKDWESFLR